MNAASRDRLGDVPGAEDITTTALRRKFRKQADPPTDGDADAATGGSVDAPARADADEITDPSVDARADAPARVGVEAPPDAPVGDAEGQTGGSEGQEVHEAAPGPQKPSQGPRRMLEVRARAYRGGWDKLRPRAVALADAVRDVLAAGGSAAEVRGLLAEVGVQQDAIPPEVKEALKGRR